MKKFDHDALAVFSNSREVLVMAREDATVIQAPSLDLANNKIKPGIMGMSPGYGMNQLGRMLQEGDVLLRMSETSGFPFLILAELDAYNVGEFNGFGYNADHIKITRAWKRIPRMHEPILLPPKAIYHLPGLSSAFARYPIGGWVTDADAAYLVWLCALDVKREGEEDTPISGPMLWHAITTRQLLTAGSDKYLCTPLFEKRIGRPADTASAYVASGAIHSPTVMTNISIYPVYGHTYDGATQKQGNLPSSESDTTLASQVLPHSYGCDTLFSIMIKADDKDPEAANLPDKSDIEVRM